MAPPCSSTTVSGGARTGEHTQPPPPRFGVVAGNIVHQIRATLDNLVWQLVIANEEEPTGGSGGNQFPIFTEPGKEGVTFVQRTTNTLRGVHPDHVAFIEGLQPYMNPEWSEDTHPLLVLADLSNTDKHQILEIVHLTEPTEGVQEFPATFEGDTVDRVIQSLVFPIEQRYAGAVVGWAQLSPSGFHPDVQMERGNWNMLTFSDGRPVLDTLTNTWATVEIIFMMLRGSVRDGRPPTPFPFHPDLVRDLIKKFLVTMRRQRT